MDILSRERRSWNMSRIRGRDTAPEKIVRSVLRKLGYRLQLHVKDLLGRPDIVLPRRKTVVFVHGCFWHRHSRCQFAYTPKTRRTFWLRKFTGNRDRDARARRHLRKLGWKVITVWECQTCDMKTLTVRLKRLLSSG